MYITIGFSTPRQKWLPIAWLIRRADKTPYSHTYIRIWSRSIQRSFIYHAAGESIHFSNIWRFHSKNEIIKEFDIPVSEIERDEVLQHLYDNLEVPYGRKQLVGLALVKLIKSWFNIKIHNPLKDGEKAQTCHELVANVLKKIGEKVDKDAEDQGMAWIYGEVKRVSEKRLGQS